MKPQLAKTLGPKFDNFPCYLQPKLNGVRALYQNGRFQSRDEHLWPPNFLSHLTLPLSTLCSEGTLLDGELYVHGWRLQRINRAVAINATDRGPVADTLSIQYHVFDLINRDLPFSRRWLEYAYGELSDASNPSIVAVPTHIVHNRREVEQYFQHYISLGYEGIMLRPDGPYEFQSPTLRSSYLYKYKSWKDGEYRCTGITSGEGKASNGIGALILTTSLGKAFNCGTGFTDEERFSLMQNPPIGRLVRVRFNNTTDEGVPVPCAFLAVIA